MASGIRTVACGVALGAVLTWPSVARAGETIIPISGEVPVSGPDHFFVPFDVPAGTLEIEVRHTAGSSMDVLDWGLLGPDGPRGWGGGNSEPAIVSDTAASRSYTPGPIEVGEWSVIVGKAKIVSDPATYDLEIILRDELTLLPRPGRGEFVDPTLEEGLRWYAGDMHVHSLESGDARPDLDEIATFARGRGLDFVLLTDHNVDSTLEFITDAQSRHPQLLMVPGVEFTTYAGHANAFGATEWVDHKIGQPGVTIEAAAQAFADQDAVFTINHPMLDLGDLCIGCAWDHDLDPELVGAVEIATGGLEPFGDTFSAASIEFWEDLCDMGFHVAPVGGSDDHKAGVGLNPFQSPIGDATTMIEADALSLDRLRAGLRDARTVVKLQGVDDPMISIDAPERVGDTVPTEDPVMTVTVEGAEAGDQVRIVVDGTRAETFELSSGDEAIDFPITAVLSHDVRARAELWIGGTRRVMTSYLWFPYVESTDDETGTGDGPSIDGGGGCACGVHTADRLPAGWLFFSFFLVPAGRRLRRRKA